MEWTVPKMWPGATCYILGGGPSLPKADMNIVRKKRTIATNNAYQLAPWSEFLFFMDHVWFGEHQVRLASYHGIKVSIGERFKTQKGIKFLQRGSKTMLSIIPTIVNNGNNSGYCAVNLAFHLGVTRIILVGFDMRVVDSKHNFHDEHQRKMLDNIYQKEYIPNFDSIKEPLQKRGVTIFNTCLDSDLKCFPFVSLKETEGW